MAQSSPGGKVWLWVLLTLALAALLAAGIGSATPRLRLLGLFPLCLGAITAFCGYWLVETLRLELSRTMGVWVLLLAAAILAGSNVQSWRVWRTATLRDQISIRRQMEDLLKDVPAEERDELFRNHARELAQRLTFASYLSSRLEAFARQIGRREVWAPPVPEILFAAEIALAAIGALIVLLASTGSGPWAGKPIDRPDAKENP